MADDEHFEALWRAQHLDRIDAAIALGETVTARTLAASARLPSDALSFSAPPLPSISLGAAGDGVEALDAPSTEHTHDLLVLAKLGEGGMGKVLLARQRSLAREVAVKVLRPEHSDFEDAQALLREAVVMGGIEHSNIVPVHALGRDEKNHPVLVMKRIDGTSWRELLHDPDHPRWRALIDAHGDRLTANLEVLMRVADATHFAHARGIVHRDIKPDNVMVGSFGEVYLVDWGIAVRLDRDRAPSERHGPQIRGTPMYMAPEMISGDLDRIDARTDVYLLGATLHEVLTRLPRHQGTNLHAVLYSAHVSKPFAYEADVPEELAALCNDATHLDPARRPQSAQEFRRRVAEFLGHRASLTLAATAQSRLATLEAGLAGASLDDATARRLATESLFGFSQSLEVWSANPRAKEGLSRARRCLFEYELSRENLDAARALAHELEDDTAETRARLEGLSTTLKARRLREAEALQEVHERDLSVKASERLPAFAALASVSMAINFALWSPGAPASAVSLAELTRHGGVVVAASLALLLLAWKQVASNRINRQLAAFGAICVVATFVHRALLLFASPHTPVQDVLLVDELLLSAIGAVAATSIMPWLGWVSAWALAGATASAASPERATLWFALVTVGLMLTIFYFVWVRARSTAGR